MDFKNFKLVLLALLPIIGYGQVRTFEGDNILDLQDDNFIISLYAPINEIFIDSLEAWYPFNGNTNDYSGNDHNAINSGASLTHDRFGFENSAYRFISSENDFMTIDTLFYLRYRWSISVWLHLADTTTEINHTVVSDSANNRAYCLSITEGTPDLLSSRNESVLFTVNTDNKLNTWNHYVVSVDSNTARFYIDKTQIGSDQSITADSLNCKFIGVRDNFGNKIEYFDGVIDDIRLYTKALSPSEVAELFHEKR